LVLRSKNRTTIRRHKHFDMVKPRLRQRGVGLNDDIELVLERAAREDETSRLPIRRKCDRVNSRSAGVNRAVQPDK
jgi:hypothetical protein